MAAWRALGSPALLVLLAACGSPSEGTGLEALEARLAARPVTYRGHARGSAFRPTGAYADGGTLWVYAEDHQEQWGYRRTGARWRRTGSRRGPRRTVRCEAFPAPTGCLCLGRAEPGGLRRCGRAERFGGEALPDRGGMRAMARAADGRLHVLDGPAARVHVLSADGLPLGAIELAPGAYGLAAGGGRLWVASWLRPHLYAVELDGARVDLGRAAPVRDLAFDARRQVLWVVGPNPAPVRRDRGPLRGLYARLEAYGIGAGGPSRVHDVDLRQWRLVDPTKLSVLEDGRVAVVATGSRAVGLYDPARGALERVAVGLAPAGAAPFGSTLAVVGRLDDTVTLADRGPPLRLTPNRAPTPAELGEVLFTDRLLWDDHVDNDFTCNSCHWEGRSDHRMHPGFREARWERTRTTAGTGMVAPLFTPMQAPTLTRAIEGFLEVLDRRHWTEGSAPRDMLRFTVGLRRVRLRPKDVRAALLHYLMGRRVEPGPWRRPDRTFPPAARAGLVRFRDACARCHEPTRSLRDRARVPDDALEATLRERPLAFGAPLFIDSGVEPRFTPAGQRVSPLIELGRGGPYFSNGSAPTLDSVLRRTDPTARRVHAPAHAERPPGSPSSRAELRAFLLAL
ncbi:MAG: hypothetical protein ACFCGT_15730 [Sandaracinaceae bacterium]